MSGKMTQATGLTQAAALYAAHGVDVEAAMATLAKVSISIHCWQGDDIRGFENNTGPTGGIAVTGAYPGRARGPEELMADLDTAMALIPGKHRINLHAIYAVSEGSLSEGSLSEGSLSEGSLSEGSLSEGSLSEGSLSEGSLSEGGLSEASPSGLPVSRDALEPQHFAAWVNYAKARGLGLDFNPTFFAHEMAADGLTLTHPDEKVRRFWINHAKATRRIAAYFGEQLGTPALHNTWIPDGYKDTPADRLAPRARLKASLDEIFSVHYDPAHIVDSLESKLFGIGVESYTPGSHEFYLQYAQRNHLLCLLDSGHFHPTETISDKISSMLLFNEKLALHVTRGVRWDSDHVVIYDDELKAIAQAIVSCGALDRVLIGLDYFDATINRVAAWVIGVRNMQKALLYALLMPHAELTRLQEKGDFTGLLALTEELKTYPFGAVWDAFCEQNNVPLRETWLETVRRYDTETRKRG